LYIRDGLGWELLVCPQTTQSDKPFWLLQICHGLYLKIHWLPELLILHMQNYHDFYIWIQIFTSMILILIHKGDTSKCRKLRKKCIKNYYTKYGLVQGFLHWFISSKQWFPLKGWLTEKDILTREPQAIENVIPNSSLDFVFSRQNWSHQKGGRWTESELWF